MKKGKVIDKANRYHTCKQTKRKAVGIEAISGKD
jgi:hypothetical protein